MPLVVTAHYLTIEWQEPGMARRVEASSEPIEIETADDGRLQLEVQIFPEDHAWLGLRLGGVLSRAKPAWHAPDGQPRTFMAVKDQAGVRWWVPALAWDADAKRHLNAFTRSLGSFELRIGQQRLDVTAVMHGSGRVQLEDYLRDFQDDLIWLALGFDGLGAPSQGGRKADSLLAAALADFTDAAARIARSPATEMRERTGVARVAKVRPNAATFRQHMRTPSASHLPGRLAEASADIADNRFLRYMATACASLASAFGRAAERQAAFMAKRADIEAERAETYRAITHQAVDPAVFDRQLAELDEQLEAVSQWRDDEPATSDLPQGHFPIRLTSAYRSEGDQFFYDRLVPKSEEGIAYRVVRLPKPLARLVSAILHFSQDYVFRGTAKSGTRPDSKRKTYRWLELEQVSKVEPRTRALENKRRKRTRLERDGWMAPLNLREQREYREAARTAKIRSLTFRAVMDNAQGVGAGLSASLSLLRQTDLGLRRLGVATSPQIPPGMRYSLQPDYAACLAAYRRLQALAQRSGMADGALDALDRIGTLHASALYERWCLVKILAILITDFRFLPPPGWQEPLIAAVTGVPQPFSLALCRPELSFGALLDVQPVLGNGRRPDFRLRFTYLPPHPERPSAGGLHPDDLPLFATSPGLIMDAKFRTAWRAGEIERMLDTLITQKRYDCEGDRVFLLHPVAGAVAAPTSPLEWGAHCDYGHNPHDDHRRGTVWLAPNAGEGDAQRHLRRLIGLALQSSFASPLEVEPSAIPEVMRNIRDHADGRESDGNDRWNILDDEAAPAEEKIWISPSCCLSCGQAQAPDGVTERTTSGNHSYWVLSCRDCKMVTTRTHCYGRDCNTVLFKNHLGTTYHRTIANQPTNVVCPSCGVYFDEDFRSED